MPFNCAGKSMSKNSRATSWLVYCAELDVQKRTIISDCFWPIVLKNPAINTELVGLASYQFAKRINEAKKPLNAVLLRLNLIGLIADGYCS
jgi:hypothetical protein